LTVAGGFAGIIPEMWQRYTIPAGTTVINWIIDYNERMKQLHVISQASQHGGAAALKVLRRLSLSDCLRLKHTHTHLTARFLGLPG